MRHLYYVTFWLKARKCQFATVQIMQLMMHFQLESWLGLPVGFAAAEASPKN